jgi:endonuclease/exonuclease/phosphatase family metal-dependent hydrolase
MRGDMRAAATILVLVLVASAACGGGAGAPPDGGLEAAPPDDGPADATAADAAPADGPRADAATPDGPAAWAPYGLLSLNLHCLKLDGTGFADNAARFATIAQAAAAEEVRVLVVQEACRTASADATALLGAALESATGAAWSRQWVSAHTAWAGTADEAEEGVGILARGELRDVRTLVYAVQGPLRRVALGARLPEALGGLRVWSTHLEVSDAAARLAQARETAAALVTLASPSLDVVVGGDFNDVATAAPCAAIGAYGFTDLSDGLAAERIDHVYAHRGAALAATARATLFDGTTYPVVSDHHGVLVTLAPATPVAVTRTTIRAHVDVGPGHWIAVRGGTAPLDWGGGWPAVATASAEWTLVLTALAPGAAFEYKCLRDDVAWQTGANAVGTGGADNDVTPSF